MMKKRMLALMFAMMLTALNPSALAAKGSKTPTLKLKSGVSAKGVATGRTSDVSVEVNTPGFLHLWLQDATENLVRTYYTDAELHTKINYFNISYAGEDGTPLAPGTYTLCATMVDQLGASSNGIATASVLVRLPEDDESAVTSGLLTAQQAATLGISAAPTSSLSPSTASVPEATSGAAVAVSSDLGYAASSSAMVGLEGYQIGIGVSDSAAMDGSYWTLPENAGDAEIWAALTRPLVALDGKEADSAYLYDTYEEGRKQLGTVSGLAQGLHVVETLNNGWSLVECYRNEDGSFMRGYIQSKRLKTIDVNQTYGLVIDKASQMLIVYMNGARIGSTPVSTGLPTSKYLYRETPAGEFMTATRRGTIEYYNTGDWSRYTIRINGNYHLMEIPTTKKNGKDYSPMLSLLGMKSTRGNVVVANAPSMDGGINAEWLWNMTDKNKKVKVLILDDKPRTAIPAVAGT